MSYKEEFIKYGDIQSAVSQISDVVRPFEMQMFYNHHGWSLPNRKANNYKQEDWRRTIFNKNVL